jgi:exopolyphosphatase/guanosine-5'-triphosphate,3'-diphosphate pyrophosphatase
MATSKKAVIDLGSNTFHLLIVDANHQCMHRERSFVRLAEEGIERIGDAAFQRGIEALLHFYEKLNAYNVQQCKVVGTAALRSASNASAFIEEVKEKTGLEIEVIDGKQEAYYIYKGIATVVPMHTGNHLIMDIGGGSVEFILVKDGTPVDSRSFNIGISQMFAKLAHSYPISPEERSNVVQYIQGDLDDLKDVLRKTPIKAIIGASGSFEVLEAMYNLEVIQGHYNILSGEAFRKKAAVVYTSTLEELLANPAIPASRAKLITMAFILIECILDLSEAPAIYISPVAMKEGILSEMNE